MTERSEKMRRPKIITNKELMEEWDWVLNNNEGLYPDKLTLGSGKKAHFIYSRGHSFYSVIASRKHNGCPECSKFCRISRKEQIVFFYIKKNFKDAISSYHVSWLGRKELDIYIPSIKTAIEFDGERFHKNINEDLAKDKLCKEHGIKLYHIRELRCPYSNKFKYQIRIQGYKDSDLERAIIELLNNLGCVCNVNLKNDSAEILQNINQTKIENNLATKNPSLSSEWNEKLNGNLTPENVTCGSNLKVWWTNKCCKHTWLASIKERNRGKGCPYCRNLAPLKGFNTAIDRIPNINKYWDYDKNNKTPDEVVYSSRKKFYFKCPKCKNKEYVSLINIAEKIKRKQPTLCTKCNNLIARKKNL